MSRRHPLRASLFATISAGLLLSLGTIAPSSVLAAPNPETLKMRSLKGTSLSNQVVRTSSSEVLEVMLADGTALTLSPGSSITVKRFSYRRGGGGELSIRVNAGTVRIVGGKVNDTGPIQVSTPQATISLEAGTMLVAVSGGQTRAHLLNGRGFDFTSGGVTKRVYRPEFQVSSSGGAPKGPSRMSADAIYAGLAALNPGLVTRTALAVQDETRQPAPKKKPGKKAAGSSAQGGSGGGGAKPGTGNGTGGSGQSLGTPVAGAPPADEEIVLASLFQNAIQINPNTPTTTGGTGGEGNTLGGGSAFVGSSSNPVKPFDASITAVINDGSVGLIQQNFSDYVASVPRANGPTTNKIFSSDRYDLTLDSSAPSALSLPTGTFYALNSQQAQLDVGAILLSSAAKDTLAIIKATAPDAFGSYNDEEDKYGPTHVMNIKGGYTVDIGRLDANDTILDGRMINSGFAIVPDRSAPIERGPDNFIMIDAMGLASDGKVEVCGHQVSDVEDCSVVDDPNNLEGARLAFAAGDLDGRVDHMNEVTDAITVDRFYISPGISDDISFVDGKLDRANGGWSTLDSRAFARAETFGPGLMTVNGSLPAGVTALDSGMFVVNPKQMNLDSAILHVDFRGVLEGGVLTKSSVSATVGAVHYRETTETDGTKSVDALVAAHTVGSTNSGDGKGSTLFSGDLYSTSAGGGNLAIDNDHDGKPDAGHMGYVVLEDYGSREDDASGAPPQTMGGGLENAVGSTTSDPYAILRLGIAAESEKVIAGRTLAGSSPSIGYAAGLVEVEGSSVKIEAIPVTGGYNVTDLAFGTGPGGVSMQGIFCVSACSGPGAKDLALGGAGLSAYVDDYTYGARLQDVDMAFVAGDLLRAALVDGAPAQSNPALKQLGFADDAGFNNLPKRPTGAQPSSREEKISQYVQWGFFFGDTAGAGAIAQQHHVHLGTFATGKPVPYDEYRDVTARVTYQGYMVGNVAKGTELYSAAGTYKDTFDFGRRQGEIRATFDGQAYVGDSAAGPGGYAGSLVHLGSTSPVVFDQNLTGRVNGQFVGGVNPGNGAPNALVGGFAIDGKLGADNYQATGTIGAVQD